MRARRGLWMHALLVAFGVASLFAGMVVGMSGCGFPCHCDELTPIEAGAYEIVESSERPELVGGMVEITTDYVEVSFTDIDGQNWVVNYTVLDEG